MHLQRIRKLQELLKEKNIQGILVTDFYNIFYLSGFRGIDPAERESAIFITQNNSYLYLPQMYQLQGKNLDSIKNNTVKLVIDKERDGLLTIFGKYLSQNDNVILSSSNVIPSLSKDNKMVRQAHHDTQTKDHHDIQTIFFEGNNLKFSEYRKIKEKLSVSLEDGGSIIENLRIIKDNPEIEKIRKAAEITDMTFNEIVKYLEQKDYTEITELEIVDKIREFSRGFGGEGFGFDPIVAPGSGSAEPHYHTSNKKLPKDESLLFDFGIQFEGYTADLSRNVFLGKATDKYKKTHNIVLECNKKSIAKCKAGVKASDLYKEAETFLLNESGMPLIHGLGHSLGLEIHEKPTARATSKEILQKNMLLTIEPGLYYEGKFGIRIEDLVVIGEKGCEILSNRSNKELIEIL